MASPPLSLALKRVYETRAPCARVLEDLRRSVPRIPWWVGRRPQLETVAWGAPFVSTLCLFALAGLTAALDLSPVWLLVAFLLVFVIFIVCAVVVSRGSFNSARALRPQHQELTPQRHEFATQVVTLLKTDISPEEPLEVRLDLRREDHGNTLLGTRTTPTGWQVKRYANPWFHLQGRLLEGTYFQLDRTERLDQRSRWTKTSSGKSKHKIRYQTDAIVRLRLRFKPERYAHLMRLEKQAPRGVRLPPGAHLKALRVRADRLELTVRLTDVSASASTQGVAMALLSLFHILHLSRG